MGMRDGETGELRVRNAALEAEVRLLREMAESLRAERDRWAAQAERLALVGPQSVPAQSAVPQRSWWPWGRSA
jgi:C4-dicarboxylate-specific signal transduction histidine kinase